MVSPPCYCLGEGQCSRRSLTRVIIMEIVKQLLSFYSRIFIGGSFKTCSNGCLEFIVLVAYVPINDTG